MMLIARMPILGVTLSALAVLVGCATRRLIVLGLVCSLINVPIAASADDPPLLHGGPIPLVQLQATAPLPGGIFQEGPLRSEPRGGRPRTWVLVATAASNVLMAILSASRVRVIEPKQQASGPR